MLVPVASCFNGAFLLSTDIHLMGVWLPETCEPIACRLSGIFTFWFDVLGITSPVAHTTERSLSVGRAGLDESEPANRAV